MAALVTGGLALATLAWKLVDSIRTPPPSTVAYDDVPAGDRSEPVVLYEIYTGPGGIGSESQFCLKVEAFLRAAGIDYAKKMGACILCVWFQGDETG